MESERLLQPWIIGPCKIGQGTLLARDVTIGHPSKPRLIAERSFGAGAGAMIGDGCIIRSGTVIYENVVIGNEVHTAHHVVIREGARIGNACVLGNGTEIQVGARLGTNVHLQSAVMISEGAVLGNNVFMGQGVVFTGSRFMTGAFEAAGLLTGEEAKALEGSRGDGPSVVVEDDVRIGANAVILSGVRLGRGCTVAAGSVVSTDVSPGALIAGNPGRVLKRGKGTP